MRVKFVTSIYSNLFGTEFGGRSSREYHYKVSMLSILKMSNADFVIYCSNEEYDNLSKYIQSVFIDSIVYTV